MRHVWAGVAVALVAGSGCEGCVQETIQKVTAQGELSPAVFSFGVVRVGATCTGTVRLKNVGQQAMSVSGSDVKDDSSNGAFTVGALGSEVEAGGQADVTIQYAPSQASTGLQSATITVFTNDPDNNGKITGQVTGEASDQLAGKVLPSCKVNIDDTEETSPCSDLEFGGTPVNGSGMVRTVNIFNDGTASFRVLGVNILPPEGSTEAVQFTLDSINGRDPSAVLPAEVLPSRGGDCGEPLTGNLPSVAISLAFRPTRAGATSARVQVITDAITTGVPATAPAGQAHLSVAGMGSQAGLSLDPEFIAFGTVAVGSSATQNVRVANLNIQQALVNTTCIDLNDNGTCYQDPACTSGCALDPADLACTGGAADPTLGLNCKVQNSGKGFQLAATDAQPGGADEKVVEVSWTPVSAGSFSKNLLFMTNISANNTYSVHLTGGVAGHIVVEPTQLLVRAATDTLGATGSADFVVRNDGQADLVISQIKFQGSVSISDDFKLTRDEDPAFHMDCTRGLSDQYCTVQPWATPITIAQGASTHFRLAYADNDEIVSRDEMTIDITHNGSGGSPFPVDVTVCRPATDGGGSNRPVCP